MQHYDFTMKTTKSFLSANIKQACFRFLAVGLLSAASLITHAQVATTLVDFGPGTGAYDVMIDPFNPATGLFLAALGDTEVGNILRLDLAQNPVSTTLVDSYPGRIDQLAFDSRRLERLPKSFPDRTDGNDFWQPLY